MKQSEIELEEMQKQISAQNDNIAKIQSDLQALAERLEKKISDEINDLKNKTLNGLELTVKQLQKDLKNTKYETESQKQNKAEHYFDTERGIQNATMGKDDSKAVDDRKQPYRKQPNKNQVQSEKENIVEVQKSFSKVLAEKDKQYQSLKQKYETLVHEKQDRELKLQSEIEEVTKNLDDTKATYIKQIEGLHEQLKRKEAISLPKLQSAGSEQVKKLQSALNESETQRKLLLQQKEDAESSAVDLQATLNQYKQTLNCLEQTKSEVTKKVEEQKHEINALKQTNLEVTNKMKEQEHKINTLKKQVQEMKRPNENRVHLQCTKGSDGFISQTTLHSPDHNQNGKNSLQSVKVDQVPKTQEEEEPRTSAPLKDQPNGISSKPAETPVAKDPNKVCKIYGNFRYLHNLLSSRLMVVSHKLRGDWKTQSAETTSSAGTHILGSFIQHCCTRH